MNAKYLEAVVHPAQVYGSPDDVLSDLSLSRAEKREVLESWESEAIHRCEEPKRISLRSASNDQGLSAIRRALDAL
ncbi:hypothetical protein [Pelagicoccus sp. SDUM812003]|uniref:hypothetical protein n=1 Tax=Pelagicoccus sp. SDUM812003 TaxID=3041267 RepID=UPI00280F0F14|nr:hypothetical protein [Pelagicoccus sp. SDUM812003]MDQ8201504.1 hypothetical protein [Pelagicoccus sp. SDUM812003]